MGSLRHYRVIEFHQVCAIARVVLLRDPTVDDAEWKAAVKDTCATQGYDEPPADMLTRAMAAVEHALLRTMGPRPVKGTPAPMARAKPVVPLTPKEWVAFGVTVRSVLARTVNAAPVNIRPLARATLTISEHVALDRFYLEATRDRLGSLRRFAELAIVRAAAWDYERVRAESSRHNLHAIQCFVCRTDEDPLTWHHVIQIQHGGSNVLRNRVALCAACHADVHPWLPKVERTNGQKWLRFAQVVSGLEVLVEQVIDRRRTDEAV